MHLINPIFSFNFRINLILFFTIAIIIPPITFSNEFNFKARAREHVESHHIKGKNFSEKYLGLNNTVNLWWEKPYDQSIGFSISPIIAGLKTQNEDSALGSQITYINYGIEYKSFLKQVSKEIFYRIGVGYSKLEPIKGSRHYEGNNYYLGLGQEIPINNFGLALEMAFRKAKLDDEITIESITPSIGFHFYKNL